jgi:hypothetical protein
MNPPPTIPSTAKPKKKFLRVVSRDLQEVREFIDALVVAVHSARDSGGTYSAFLPLRGGVNVLQIEVTNHVGGSQK